MLARRASARLHPEPLALKDMEQTDQAIGSK
jgi:hypothetical protein